jgi:hypothetical protein
LLTAGLAEIGSSHPNPFRIGTSLAETSFHSSTKAPATVPSVSDLEASNACHDPHRVKSPLMLASEVVHSMQNFENRTMLVSKSITQLDVVGAQVSEEFFKKKNRHLNQQG